MEVPVDRPVAKPGLEGPDAHADHQIEGVWRQGVHLRLMGRIVYVREPDLETRPRQTMGERPRQGHDHGRGMGPSHDQDPFSPARA